MREIRLEAEMVSGFCQEIRASTKVVSGRMDLDVRDISDVK